MEERGISLTQAEWSVMECLWEEGPLTGREVTRRMEKRCGWSRSTTRTLLGRLEAKKAVGSVPEEKGPKVFCPLLRQEDAVLRETEDFLSRVYQGSPICWHTLPGIPMPRGRSATCPSWNFMKAWVPPSCFSSTGMSCVRSR